MSRLRAPLLACRMLSSATVPGLGAQLAAEVQYSSIAQTLSNSAAHFQILNRALPQAGALAAGVRSLSASAAQQQAAASGASQRQQRQRQDKDLTVERDEFGEITDKHIPQRPVGAVEGASYTVVIIGGLVVAGAVLWAAANELLIQPKEYTCFNLALERIREDPRVTVRLGTPISAYGQESRNRAARQRIPHRSYTDSEGVEHHQIQFHAKGPSGGVAVVNASMYQDSAKQWQYDLLFLDFGGPVQSRVFLEGQQQY